MAYDKVVDSSVLDAGLKAIADAIREKGGTSDVLAFPTAMAEAIAAIEAGGDYGYYSKIIFGTYTPANDVTELNIPEASDFNVPSTTFVIEYDQESGTVNSGYTRIGMQASGTRVLRKNGSTVDTYRPQIMSTGQVIFTSCPLQAGITYNYFIAEK